MFFKGSRYEKVETVKTTDAVGREIAYKKVRVITPPRAERMHTVNAADRLDLVADRYFREPERFWRICDCNLALWPPDLVERPGRRIAIPAGLRRYVFGRF